MTYISFSGINFYVGEIFVILSLHALGINFSSFDVWLTVHRNSVWIRKTN